MRQIVRVEDVFTKAGIQLPTGHKHHDSTMETICPICSTKQRLSEARVQLSGDETTYECKNGCQIILVVGEPGETPWMGRGYRLKDYVIRNVSDLHVQPIPGSGVVFFPACPDAVV